MDVATDLYTRTALDTFTQCGLGVLRSLIGEREVGGLLAECDRLWKVQDPAGLCNLRYGMRPGPGGTVVIERIDPVADVSEVFATLNRDPRLVDLAEAALGEPVTVLKEKLIYKWPGTGGYEAHRDGPYLDISGVPGSEIITLLVALDPTTIENGTTEFFPGLRLVPTASPPGEPRDVANSAIDGEWSLMPELARGDVAIFDGLLPHQSGPNGSDTPRRTYFLTFAPARYADCRAQYYAERRRQQHAARAHVIGGQSYFR
jgi:hypothetical protein